MTRKHIFFGVGQLVNKGGATVVFLAIYTFLPEYSVVQYGLAQSILLILLPLLTLNMHLAAERIAFDYVEDSPERNTIYLTTTLTAILLSILFGVVVVSVVGAFLLDVALVQGFLLGDSRLLLLIFAQIVLSAAYFGTLTIIRAEGMSFPYLKSAIANYGSVFIALLGCIFIGATSLCAVIMSLNIGLLIGAAYNAFCVKSYLHAKFNKKIIPSALRYSWPTVIHLVFFALLLTHVRWIGADILGSIVAAHLMLLSFVIATVGTFARGLYEAVRPQVMAAMAKKDYPVALSSLRSTCQIALMAPVFAFGLFFVFAWFTSVDRLNVASSAICIAFLVSVVDVVYVSHINIILGAKKTKTQAAITIGSFFVSLAASLVLSSFLALNGLLLGLVCGFLFQYIGARFVAGKITNEKVLKKVGCL